MNALSFSPERLTVCSPEGPPGHFLSTVVAEHTGAPGSVSSLAPALPRGGCVEAALGSDDHSMNI